MPPTLPKSVSIKYRLRQTKNTINRECLRFHNVSYNKNPIIITGNQKSGTSAIASLLSIAIGENCTVDIFSKLGDYEIKLLDNEVSFNDFLRMSEPYWHPRIVKEPEFVLYLNDIKYYFEEAPIVFIVRDPLANIRSILSRLDITPKSCDEVDFKSDNFKNYPLWRLMFDSSRMPYGGNSPLEQLAQRWQYVAEQINEHKHKSIVVRYEDFLADKLRFIEGLATRLDCKVVNDITPLLDMQYQPKGSTLCVKKYFTEQQIELIKRCTCNGRRLFNYD